MRTKFQLKSEDDFSMRMIFQLTLLLTNFAVLFTWTFLFSTIAFSDCVAMVIHSPEALTSALAAVEALLLLLLAWLLARQLKWLLAWQLKWLLARKLK